MDLLREFFEGDRQDDFFPLNLRRSLQRILRFRFICLKSKVLSFFSIMTCVIIFNYLGFFTFCLPIYCKTIVCSDDKWFSEFFLTSPFVMWQVSWRIWEPYYVSDPLIANFVSFKEIRAAEIVFYWGILYKFWLPPGMLGDWFCYY